MDEQLVHIPEDVRHEFEVDIEGKVFAKSRNAVARISGVSKDALVNASGRGLLQRLLENKNIPESLKPFAGQDYTQETKIPDFVVAGIVKYYA
ncbi:hypothetical protein [Fischerella sp. PCC 9605]|uniref:hypothetical protein n=1 Tax=Fischerella sp. PCC 9605 TaxID=1173024 RepID=UPI00047DCB6D|nr:hypothetical protein [Fischerella sp. PCC 9605]